MKAKEKWLTKVRIFTLLMIIVGVFYWIVGRLQVGITSFFKKKEIMIEQDKDDKECGAE